MYQAYRTLRPDVSQRAPVAIGQCPHGRWGLVGPIGNSLTCSKPPLLTERPPPHLDPTGSRYV